MPGNPKWPVTAILQVKPGTFLGSQKFPLRSRGLRHFKEYVSALEVFDNSLRIKKKKKKHSVQEDSLIEWLDYSPKWCLAADSSFRLPCFSTQPVRSSYLFRSRAPCGRRSQPPSWGRQPIFLVPCGPGRNVCSRLSPTSMQAPRGRGMFLNE